MSTSDNDAVRRFLYGTATGSGTLSTADIAWFVANNPNVRLAAAEAAMAEATNLSRKPDRTVGDISISYTGSVQGFRQLSKDLRRSGLRSVKPFAGGITITSKDTERDDTDRVAPAFRTQQFDNPTSGSTST